MLVRELNEDERPLARLRKSGTQALSDSELLSIIFGGQTGLRVARAVLRNGLQKLHREIDNPAVAPLRKARIAALLELSKRLVAIEHRPGSPIDTAVLAARLGARYRDVAQEHCGAVYLDARLRLICEREIFVGSLATALVSIREFLKLGLLENAAALIVYHNHPSGDPTPSPEDYAFTRRLVDAAKTMEIEVLDHIVFGRSHYLSFKERGYL